MLRLLIDLVKIPAFIILIILMLPMILVEKSEWYKKQPLDRVWHWLVPATVWCVWWSLLTLIAVMPLYE